MIERQKKRLSEEGKTVSMVLVGERRWGRRQVLLRPRGLHRQTARLDPDFHH